MIPTLAYPNSVVMTIDGLDASTLSAIADADVRPGVPTNFDYGRKLIVVKRVGGGPDEDDLTTTQFSRLRAMPRATWRLPKCNRMSSGRSSRGL
jgi:hypothetical protein